MSLIMQWKINWKYPSFGHNLAITNTKIKISSTMTITTAVLLSLPQGLIILNLCLHLQSNDLLNSAFLSFNSMSNGHFFSDRDKTWFWHLSTLYSSILFYFEHFQRCSNLCISMNWLTVPKDDDWASCTGDLHGLGFNDKIVRLGERAKPPFRMLN